MSVKDVLLKPIAYVIGVVFYDRQFLKGKYFKKGYSRGWRWIVKCFFMQKIIGINRAVPFPVDFRMDVANWRNIIFDLDDMNIFQKVGNYYQAAEAKIYIGKNTWIANGVKIISSNHDLNNLDIHAPGEDVVIGDGCWLAANSVILPGVTLGEHTVVAAGAVVTKSFPEGWCVIGGVPAKKIKEIEKEERRV